MDTAQFIEELFGLKDDDAHILTWEKDKPTKKSRWFKNHIEAAAYIKGKTNIYIGAGLSLQDRGPNKRYTIEQVHGSPGFFIDIDVTCGTAHKNKNLPPTIEDARSLIENYGWDPTIIIHSGHGLQAWWLFKEPLMFDNIEEQMEILELSRRLQATIQEKANEKGWKIDNTANIDRLTRPVGTINKKDGCEPVEAIALTTNGPRYNHNDFDEFLIYELKKPSNPKHNSESRCASNPKADSEPVTQCNPMDFSESIRTNNPMETSEPNTISNPINHSTPLISITKQIQAKSDNLILDENASPPFEKFGQISSIFVPDFINTWNNNRDNDLNDTSPSGYDFTLALMAAQCKWTDQEIMDLMVAFRRHNGHDLHIKNKQKYVRTIIMAQSKIEQETAEVAVEEAAVLTQTRYEDVEKNRTAIIQRFKFARLRILKFLEDPAIFRLIVDGKKTEFRSSNKLMMFGQFREQVGNLINRKIMVKDEKEWNGKLVHLVMSLIEEVKPDAMRTSIGIVKIWLKKYLRTQSRYGIEDAAPTNQAFVHKGYWYIYPLQFLEWTRTVVGNKESNKELFRILEHDLKLAKEKINYSKKDGKRSSTNAWRVPMNLVPGMSNVVLGTSGKEFGDEDNECRVLDFDKAKSAKTDREE